MLKPNVRFQTYLFALSAVVLLLPMPSLAQTAVLATIRGTITDATGLVVPAADITVTNTGTLVGSKTTTNSAGYYVVPDLPSGNYDVKVEKAGFQACSTLGVHLDPAANVQINCTLRVGQVTQTIEVQANTVQVQTTDSHVSRTVDQTQMTELPQTGGTLSAFLAFNRASYRAFRSTASRP